MKEEQFNIMMCACCVAGSSAAAGPVSSTQQLLCWRAALYLFWVWSWQVVSFYVSHQQLTSDTS